MFFLLVSSGVPLEEEFLFTKIAVVTAEETGQTCEREREKLVEDVGLSNVSGAREDVQKSF